MTGRRLLGLNWAHRRATGPMLAAAEAFAALPDGCSVVWETQPLHGFEQGLNAAAADRYDVMVFDHPFCGTIAAEGLFRPLDDVVPDLSDAGFIGRSLDSYRYAGRLWGLPVDGATQVSVYRADLMADLTADLMPPDTALPELWDEVLALGRALRRDGKWLGLAVLNPHAFLVVAALLASLGRPLPDSPGEAPDRAALDEALGLLADVATLAHPDCRRFNAIDLHEAMTRRDDIVYCPLAYGYLTYGEADHDRRLSFGKAPRVGRGGAEGAVLGGTGLGITRGCRDVAAAERFVRLLSTAGSQRRLIADHHGQPARAEPWSDPDLDRRFGGAFSATRPTMETSWVRPRFGGSIALQDRCGAVVARSLGTGRDRRAAAREIVEIWSSAAAVRETGPDRPERSA